MKRLAGFLALLTALVLAIPAGGQDSPDDRGYLQAFLEDNLSDVGRDIRIIGFDGALSARATVRELTIADDEGIWLTLKGVVLDWNRSALLSGHIEINELYAEEIILPRRPVSGSGAPSPEATAFSLPELPVSVNIAAIAAQKVSLGQPVLGEAAIVRLTGAAQLAGGAGEVALTIERTDGPRGALELDGKYSNVSKDLALSLTLAEGEDGITANLIGLPGRPSVDLGIEGAGPISDFTADIDLATNGEKRLSGQVVLAESGAGGDGAEPESQIFSANIGGDVAPVFLPAYRAFFGDAVTLAVSGKRFADGGFEIDALGLNTEALMLEGQLSLTPDGWPQKFSLTGQISDQQGGNVLLPLTGAKTFVQGADLSLRYDAATGDEWSGSFHFSDLSRDDLSLARTQIAGAGQLVQGEGSALGQVLGQVEISLQGIAPPTPPLGRAIGPAVAGGLHFNWREGAPLILSDLDLAGENYTLTGAASLDDFTGGINVTTLEGFAVHASDISQFAELAGIPLTGAVQVGVEGKATLLSGAFDVQVDGAGTSLGIGQPRFDPLITGESVVHLTASRDETGTRIKRLEITTEQARALASGALKTEATSGVFELHVNDASLVDPGLSGAASLSGLVHQTGSDWALTLTGAGPGGLSVAASGVVTQVDGAFGPASGRLSVQADSLVPYARLAGHDLTGALDLAATGSFDARTTSFTAEIGGTGQDLGIGQNRLDPLFAGQSTLSALVRGGGKNIDVERFEISSDHAKASTSGGLKADNSIGQFSIFVNDTARIEPRMSGPANLTGTVHQDGADWAVDISGAGPGDLNATANGSLTIDEGNPGRVSGTLTATAADLSPYAGLAGQTVSGGLEASVSGWADIRDGSFKADIDAAGQSLALGQSTLDLLLRGASSLKASLHRQTGPAVLDNLDLTTPELTLQATGTSENQTHLLRATARLRDLGLLAPGITGPAKVEGTAILTGETWELAFSGDGPRGANARVTGQLRADGSHANLKIDGTAPLSLANRMIRPNLVTGQASYDLSLNGKPALASVTGIVQGRAVQLALPYERLAFDFTQATARLSGGRADVTANAAVASGGRVGVSGTVSLTPPFNADLAVRLASVGLSDATLYDTIADGQATLRGPLAGGARIGADLSLGTTEIRVPEAGFAGAPVMAGLLHLNEPGAVHQSRARAGLLNLGGSAGSGKAYPIDILLRAPSRVFVRGRGLDAELGGQLRLRGTSADVRTQGQFNLIRGRLDILGKRLTLTEGKVSLQGGFDPFLRFVAQTRAEDTDVRVVVEGPASSPKVTFTSTPELPEDEVLALLLFGRDITQISPVQALRLAAAVRTLAGGGGEGIVSQLRKTFALDDLDVTTDEDGVAQATVGKYLTENIYTDVTVGSDGSSEINLNLTLSPSLTARGSVGSDGDTSLGIFFEKDY